MELVVRRRSKLAGPSPSEVFLLLVDHLALWWVSVTGEQEPRVLEANEPDRLIWSSPFVWRPDEIIEIDLPRLDHHGSVIELRQMSDQPVYPREISTLRHRWGEHLDRDLRTYFEEWSTTPYHFSAYRADVADWSLADRVEDRTWVVTEPVWAQVLADAPPMWPVKRLPAGEALLPIGTSVWSLAVLGHRSAVRCLPCQPAQIEGELPPRARWTALDDIELVIPLAEFGSCLVLASE